MRGVTAHDSPADLQSIESKAGQELITVHERRPADYDGTCLRPLGLCELGGCCDACWYRPDHPRFQQRG